MSDTPPDPVRLLAAQQGLERALELFPDAVKAAVERGSRPLGPPPAGTPALIAPAPVFNPARFERDK
jgi:hypothetical protein